nr:hypothetical protein [Tanacetum cinerariifolium]
GRDRYFLGTDELLPPRFENDDVKEEIDVVEDLHVENSTSNSENELSDNEASDFHNPSFPRPPPEPPDAKFDLKLNAGEEILVVMKNINELDKDECLDLGSSRACDSVTKNKQLHERAPHAYPFMFSFLLIKKACSLPYLVVCVVCVFDFMQDLPLID